jgi:hypothetical protein
MNFGMKIRETIINKEWTWLKTLKVKEANKLDEKREVQNGRISSGRFSQVRKIIKFKSRIKFRGIISYEETNL